MKTKDIYNDLRKLIINEEFSSQHDICDSLISLGYTASQSKVNRLLKKVNAIKLKSENGNIVYKIANELSPPLMTDTLLSLVLNISSNEVMVIIDTVPGGANVVARLLDYNKSNLQIIGTVAGDDSVAIWPKSIKKTNKLKSDLEQLCFK
jgi:transcriptional regulator of arginine metabolism